MTKTRDYKTLVKLRKYKYRLFGKTYFILLTDREKAIFERKYRIPLELWDCEETDHEQIH